jgi:dihydrofolate synthase/folylpolyglutamate synthase
MRKLSYKAALDFLFGIEKSGIKLGLDTTLRFLETIGNPQQHFDSVHIAGTNGKGSVACFLNSILFHGGLTTGLFTSPHLVSYRERIRTDGACISRRQLADLVSDLADLITSTRVSYFETATVLAFEHFKRQGVQIAAVEVGMGGRLDSTNVLRPLVSCITSIDFDHVKYLGRTLPKIAGEKAGIIKRGVPVVCGSLSKSASETIAEVARRRHAKVYELGKHAWVKPLDCDLNGSRFAYGGLCGERVLQIASPGLHQVSNAAVAVLITEVLGEIGLPIGDGAIEEGLRHAFWPGRLQVLRRRPLIVCDAAHNVSGARVLVRSLEEIGFRSDVTVFAVLRDKAYPRMLSLLSACSDGFVLTKPDSPRALPLYKLKQAGRDAGLRFTAYASVDRALEHALAEADSRGNLLICGSLYALGEAMQFLGFKPYLARLC